MELPTHILITYGYLLLFAWIFVEQIGIPLPATPVILAAGALSVDGPIHFPLAIYCAFSASCRLSRPRACAAPRTLSAAAAE